MPKGVLIPHINVIEFVSWAAVYFEVTHFDRVSCHPPLHFDMSVWDIFACVAAGAELHLVPKAANLSPYSMAQFIRNSKVTHWLSVPAVLSAMSNKHVIELEDFPRLKRITWAGEAIEFNTLQCLMDLLPHVIFTNAYGPTEATIICTYYQVSKKIRKKIKQVPLGVPVPGRLLKIVNDDGHEVDEGTIGHLHVGGTGLAKGYWRDSKKTAASFYRSTDSLSLYWYKTGDMARVDSAGNYFFHGREDRQIKSLGHRIELDEVAIRINKLSQIAEAAVVAIPVDGVEGMRICAAYVPSTSSLTNSIFRKMLSQTMPRYMIPRKFLRMSNLPRSDNGKVNLKELERRFKDD